MLGTALAKLVTLKVAGAAAVFVVATGGVALAAANGELPNLSNDKASAQPSPHDTGKPSQRAGKPSAHAKGGDSSPSPSLTGLCRAYQAGAGDNPGKALENPAFKVLITTAGDKDKVAAYCDSLLSAKATKAGPTARPDHPAGQAKGEKPDTVPSKPASPDHPTARPNS